MPITEANGIRLYYEVRGAGEPLVLILGLGTDVSEWGRLIDSLAKGSRVLAFDNRGAGRSDKPDAPYSIGLMADDAAALMEALALESANVMGISLGGRIALDLAIRHPHKVKKLVLVSTGAHVPQRRSRALFLDVSSRLPFVRSKYPQPRYAFTRQRQASAAYDASRNLGRLDLPTLILHGARDRFAPLALAAEMQAAIPGSRMLTFPGGHLFFVVRSRDRFTEAVAQFLRG